MNSALHEETAGFSLLEVLAGLCLVAAIGLVSSVGASAMIDLASAARSEAIGLAAAAEKLEELTATAPEQRLGGNDETVLDGLTVTRVWRARPDDPEAGLWRLEVTARWSRPSLTLLTLATVTP